MCNKLPGGGYIVYNIRELREAIADYTKTAKNIMPNTSSKVIENIKTYPSAISFYDDYPFLRCTSIAVNEIKDVVNNRHSWTK